MKGEIALPRHHRDKHHEIKGRKSSSKHCDEHHEKKEYRSSSEHCYRRHNEAEHKELESMEDQNTARIINSGNSKNKIDALF